MKPAIWSFVFLVSSSTSHGQSSELFEKKVRPVLVEHRQACHNEKLKSGGLDLTSAGAVHNGIFA